LPSSLERLHLSVDMLELGVAIGVAGTFACLAVGLQAEVEALEQAADQLLAGDETPLGQRGGKTLLALAHPPQWSLGIAANRRFHQFAQSFQKPRLLLGRRLLPAALPTNPVADPHRSGAEVGQAPTDRAARNPGRPRHRCYPAVTSSACFARSEQTSISLVENRLDCTEASLDGCCVDHTAKLEVA